MFRALFFTAAVIAAAPALAFDAKPFDPAAFAAAQAAGKSILVEVHAPWCPTCKAQAPIIDELLSMPEFKDFKLVRVNFDTQKDAVKMFKATMQSTLIVYKNGKEVGRSTGETKKDSIAALLKKSMM